MLSDTVKTRVAQFGCLQLEQLGAHEHQGDWEHYAPQDWDLAIKIRLHLDDLEKALITRDADAITKHAAAVANYAMKAHELFGASKSSISTTQ